MAADVPPGIAVRAGIPGGQAGRPGADRQAGLLLRDPGEGVVLAVRPVRHDRHGDGESAGQPPQ
jgi:hypothetical protein